MRVLFVDDERPILDALARSIFRRADVEGHFVSLPVEAIVRLHDERWDALVTDMRMPGRSGLDVLAAALESNPQALRVVLSGQSSPEATWRVLPLAHQFLAKPCDRRALSATLDAAATADELGASARRSLGALPGVAACPDALAKAGRLASLGAEPGEIADAIADDPAMVAKLLQITGSAFFRRPDPGVDLERAIARLGPSVLERLFAAGSWPASERDPVPSNFRRRSRAAGELASRIVADSARRRDARAISRLGDLGAVALWTAAGESHPAADLDTLSTEFGISPDDATQFLCRYWGVSPRMLPREPAANEARLGPGEAALVARSIFNGCAAEPAPRPEWLAEATVVAAEFDVAI